VPFHLARKAAGNDAELTQRIERTRPELVAAVGVIGLLVLYFLMVFKPF